MDIIKTAQTAQHLTRNGLASRLARLEDATRAHERLRLMLQAASLLDQEPYLALARALSAATSSQLQAREAVEDYAMGRADAREDGT